jgi:DNA-directed RNA polymerase specialized sigma subunit
MRKNIIVERLDHFDDEENGWTGVVIEDKTAGPADIARTRIDFADWPSSLKRRDRKIAELLAEGNRTRDVARRFKISAGRISQLRRELAESWRKFVGDVPGDAVPQAA